MMRIAYICADRGVPVFGRKGSSIHVQEVIRQFRRQGAVVELFARRLGGEAPPGLEGLTVHRLPKTPRGDGAVRERADLESNAALERGLAARGRFDLVYERHSLWSFAGMEHAAATGTPGLLEVNAPLLEEQRRYRGLVLEDEAAAVVRRAYGAASALLAVSQGVARHIRAQVTPPEHVYVVPNGVDPARFAAGPGQGGAGHDRDGGVFTIGFVGTLKPWHGVETLIESFAGLSPADPALRLLIVGDGPQREDLAALVRERGIAERTIFRGAVDPSGIPTLIESMDVAVAPYPATPATEEFYFSPLKILEYMAAGRAVVAAGIGQINDLVDHEVTGLLYEPGDCDALAAALGRLRADPALRRRLGAEARRVTVRDRTWRSVVQRILDIADACRANGRVGPGVSVA